MVQDMVPSSAVNLQNTYIWPKGILNVFINTVLVWCKLQTLDTFVSAVLSFASFKASLTDNCRVCAKYTQMVWGQLSISNHHTWLHSRERWGSKEHQRLPDQDHLPYGSFPSRSRNPGVRIGLFVPSLPSPLPLVPCLLNSSHQTLNDVKCIFPNGSIDKQWINNQEITWSKNSPCRKSIAQSCLTPLWWYSLTNCESHPRVAKPSL